MSPGSFGGISSRRKGLAPPKPPPLTLEEVEGLLDWSVSAIAFDNPEKGGDIGKQHLFLKHWLLGGKQLHACRKANISYHHLQVWKRDDSEFRERYDAVHEALIDRVEDSLIEMATTYKTPAAVTAAIVILNANRSGKYKRQGAEAQETNVKVELVIGKAPDAKRLPAKSGKEITIDEGEG